MAIVAHDWPAIGGIKMSVEFERRVHATLPEPRIEHFDFTLVSTTRTGPKLVVQNGRSKVIQLNI